MRKELFSGEMGEERGNRREEGTYIGEKMCEETFEKMGEDMGEKSSATAVSFLF